MNRPSFTWSLLAVLATLVVSLLAAAPDTRSVSPSGTGAGTADLALTLTADDTTPEPGQPFRYIATLANRGPAAAITPRVRILLPEHVRFEVAAVAQAGACSRSGRVVTCDYATLANGASGRRRIRVTPTRSGPLVATARATGANAANSTGSTATANLRARLPAPVQARQVNVKLVSGRVRIRQPGQRSFRRLLGEDQIRVGSQVDATQGRVRLTTTAGKGKTQTADFFEGVFKILQSRGSLPVTELRMTGRLTNCGGRSSAASGPRADAAARVKGRRLWGSGKGRFRTRGKRSAATVRGTIWRVDDRCNDTTWTVVRKGVVSVRDFGLRRNVTLRPGRTYVARPRGG